jgi:hypothetical protein
MFVCACATAELTRLPPLALAVTRSAADPHFPLSFSSFNVTGLFSLLISVPINWALSLPSLPECRGFRRPVFLPSLFAQCF